MDIGMAPEQLEAFRVVARRGSCHAAEALGMFSGNTLTVRDAETRLCSLESIPSLLGNLEQVVAAVNLAFTGDIAGYLLAYFEFEDASLLLETLTGEPLSPTQPVSELQASALGETGNIIGSAFLASLEELCGCCALPSPPAVAVEVCSAIITSAVLPVVDAGGAVLLVEAEIVPTADEGVRAAGCRLLFLPTPESCSYLHRRVVAPSTARDGKVVDVGSCADDR